MLKAKPFHHFHSAFLFLMLSLALSFTARAQLYISGKVIDAIDNLPVGGVAIHNSSGEGTISDGDGNFELKTTSSDITLTFSHLAYQKRSIKITDHKDNKEAFIIVLTPKMIGLQEVSVIASFVRERQTPVAISTIDQAIIEHQLGSQTFPEIMKMKPGIYATPQGGGFGDAKISIRGFQQENIGLLLNGVPVSSVENGLVYWSNWNGLAEATQAIQIQRGLGASRVALNSVGGTINIITRPAEAKGGGSIRYMITDYGNQQTSIRLSSGLMENGFAFTFLGSRTVGPGYVDATYVDAWSWFLNTSWQLSHKHLLSFTGMGSPEKHGQQNYGMTKVEIEQFGIRYNPNWGTLNGKTNSISENSYHKPQLALNHYWTINSRATLSSSAYLSFGDGGGKFAESFMSPPANTIRKNNQIDWAAIVLQNTSHTDSVHLESGEVVGGFSKIIQSNYMASHSWYGGLSTLNVKINDHFKVLTGMHFRYFKSNLREKISDLLGGDFWVDQYAFTLPGVAGRKQLKGIGEVINVDNDARVDVGSMFAQAEYTYHNFSAFMAGTFSQTRFQRMDRMNYIQNKESEKITKAGFDVKAGVQYTFYQAHRIYANTGYYSKAPYFKFAYANFSNAPVQQLKNERISAVEAGYNYYTTKLDLYVNTYYTLWQDKSILSNENIQLADQSQTRALIRGLDALHKGIELEGSYRVLNNLTFGAIASLGDWRWKNNVEAALYNDNQQLIEITKVYADNLKVGDAPQVQYGLTADYFLFNRLKISANWLFLGCLYADFDPATRNNPEDKTQPYRLPDYQLLDLHTYYTFEISKLRGEAGLSIYNAGGNTHILRGKDGALHHSEGFTGFWSPGRTFSFSVSLSF